MKRNEIPETTHVVEVGEIIMPQADLKRNRKGVESEGEVWKTLVTTVMMTPIDACPRPRRSVMILKTAAEKRLTETRARAPGGETVLVKSLLMIIAIAMMIGRKRGTGNLLKMFLKRIQASPRSKKDLCLLAIHLVRHHLRIPTTLHPHQMRRHLKKNKSSNISKSTALLVEVPEMPKLVVVAIAGTEGGKKGKERE